MSRRYLDIIAFPHHVSQTRPQMSARNRAAQFAPFAALTGYDGAIAETVRTASEKFEEPNEQDPFGFSDYDE